MNLSSIIHPCRKAGKAAALAALLAASLICLPSPAAALEVFSFEAESGGRPAGTTIVSDAPSSGGQFLKYTEPGTSSKRTTISQRATEVVVKAKARPDRGVWPKMAVYVDGVSVRDTGRSVASRTYANYHFAVSVPAGTHTIGIRAGRNMGADQELHTDLVRLTAPDRVSDTDGDGVGDVSDNCPNATNADQVNLDDDALGDVCDGDIDGDGRPNGTDYAARNPAVQDPPRTYDSTNFAAPKNWSPGANTTHLNPTITCSAVKAPGAIGSSETGNGAVVMNNNVELVNPNISGCSYGITNYAAGTKITFDPSKPGYDTATNPGLRNNRYGILLEEGSRDVQVRGLGTGEGFIKDNFRPVTVRAISGTSVIENLDVSHPGVYPWQQTGDKNIVGIKLLCDFDAMPSKDRRCSGLTVSSNDLHGADEEVLSADGNGNDTSRGSENTVQNTAIVTGVNTQADTVALDENLSGLPLSLVGAYMSLNTGDRGVVGEYLKITAQGASTLTVADPQNFLAGVAAGDEVSMGGVYENIVFRDNFIDMQGRAMIGGDFLGPVTHSVLENNTFVGRPYRHYANTTHYRDCLDGAGYEACLQSFAVITNAKTSGPGTGDEVSVASNNTVRNNSFSADLSTAVRHRTGMSGLPVYTSGNTFSAGYGRHNDGSYSDLQADPNP